ncbi:hypothetical protein [Halostagnicola kamekurae]|uniref:Small CPxCG-related zinc finger protein n=1 Tax=Halostagnicola kamekurae TaxID=619731 RepID=A0A1I6S739_9EURY|nr:hypothetical protein [Halostagnicola kamekurae]SFS72746.1 hypothetical protein SAMN04488556_2463 [Halostagnicola kamekurae]
MRDVLKTVLFRRSSAMVVEECRRCGTTVGSTAANCPECDCEEIVRYTIQ